MTSFDVVVVGAGPIGASAARYLSAEGGRVCVIGLEEPSDFRDHRGVWAGHYDQGRLAAPDVPLVETIIGLRSMRRFAELELATGVAFHKVHPCLTVMPKTLPAEVAATAGGFFNLKALLNNAQDLAGDGEYLDETQLAARLPHLRFRPAHDGVLQSQGMIVNPRSFVRAELTAAIGNGTTQIVDEVLALSHENHEFVAETRRAGRITGSRLVMAAGAGSVASRLLPRPVAAEVHGCTAVLVEVVDPDQVDFPTLMYFQLAWDVPSFTGIIVPPVEYPDGRWYIKLAGGSVVDCLLEGYEAINKWVRGGGHQEDGPRLFDVLQELLPGVRYGDIRTRPCPLLMNATGRPYIGLVEEDLVLASDGERGVMMGDEIGRLASELVLNGRWDDSLPSELFEIKFA